MSNNKLQSFKPLLNQKFILVNHDNPVCKRMKVWESNCNCPTGWIAPLNEEEFLIRPNTTVECVDEDINMPSSWEEFVKDYEFVSEEDLVRAANALSLLWTWIDRQHLKNQLLKSLPEPDELTKLEKEGLEILPSREDIYNSEQGEE